MEYLIVEQAPPKTYQAEQKLITYTPCAGEANTANNKSTDVGCWQWHSYIINVQTALERLN